MLKSIQQRDLDRNRWIKITMGVILVIISVSMVITLVPGLTNYSAGSSPDAVATIGGQSLTAADVQRQLNQFMRGQSMPEMLRGLYAKQVLDQMIFQRALEIEADRLGLRVTPEEQRDRIKQILPSAFAGDTWLKDRYAAEVQQRAGMSVEDFETFLRNEMLLEKFRALVTDGISAGPAEVQQEFRRRNEKVQIEYASVKPAELASTIHPSETELAAYFAKNSSKYQVPEKRSTRFALLDLAKLRERTQAGDDALRAYYNAHINQYQVENRAHVQHILFKTVGKTDAEVAEIRAQAAEALKKAKSGANFEELAKKYSEDDATKAKGGELGWIVEGQTVAAFQQAAFTLPKGSISDLVKTQYGFHIIKVLDRETAHTKTLDEVRGEIQPIVLADKVTAAANDLSNQMAAAVRQSNRQSLDDLAKKFNLQLGETPPAAFTDPVGELGSTTDLHQIVFQLRPGELSAPVLTPQGWAIVTVKDIQAAHQGALAEVREKALSAYQQDKSIEFARAKADDFAKRVQAGEDFQKAAKSLDLSVINPAAFSRTGSVADVGGAQQFESAFGMSVGQSSAPVQIAGNWIVYKVVGHEAVNQDDFAKQSDQLKQELVQSRQQAAFDAFRTALEDRLTAEGKLNINAEALKKITRPS